jgi:hypothetical protein
MSQIAACNNMYSADISQANDICIGVEYERVLIDRPGVLETSTVTGIVFNGAPTSISLAPLVGVLL